MEILLDTHTYIWCLENDKKLTNQSRQYILDANLVYVSMISVWEMAIKVKLGMLKVDIQHVISEIESCGFKTLPLQYEHILQLAHLPMHHRDPFDRMLIAQAMCKPLQFLTADARLTQYSNLVTLI